MGRLVFSLLLSVCLLLGNAGCESAALPKPSGTSTVALKEDSRRGSLTTKLNIELIIELPPPKIEGLAWRIIQNDTRYLFPLSDVSAPDARTGRATVRFQTVRVGRTQLRFAALPAQVREGKPGDTYDIIVTIPQPQ